MDYKQRILFYCLPFLFLISGVDPYEPPAIQSPNSYLVVEGYLNSGDGGTSIQISRTTNLADKLGILPETQAMVSVEGENSISYLTDENQDGEYTSHFLGLRENESYRLRIVTSGGKEYLSDPVPVKKTPPIDSVNWQRSPEGVTIFVNTHDPSGDSRYYMWEYEEVWEFTMPHESLMEYVNGSFVPRRRENSIFTCWKTQPSTALHLASSAKLQEDIIYQNPLVFIPQGSWKLGEKYSILVRQLALTGEAYNYLQHMKKNSEQQGSIFDPQPSEIRGNIQSLSNPGEPVVGYISAGTVTEQRIYVLNDELDRWDIPNNCEITEFRLGDIGDNFSAGIFNAIYVDTNAGIVYASSPECTDCTLRGIPSKPVFWD